MAFDRHDGMVKAEAVMDKQMSRAVDTYRAAFSVDPDVVAIAPGRVNLMGDHTDYNDGWVLPCAIDRWIAVAAGEGPGMLVSADMDKIEPLSGCSADTWAAHPRGVAWALADAGYQVPSFQAAFAGNVPPGSGLSSSAAIQMATSLALDTLFDLGLERLQAVRLGQLAENRFVGVNSGIMDQFVSVFAEKHFALLLDCRSLEYRQIPVDPEAASLCLLICHTGVDRRLASSGYNERREHCEQAARSLGIAALRDATLQDCERLTGQQKRYCRHVVSENDRVLAAAEALKSGSFAELGELMFDSHRSLREDFNVSTPQLDEFVHVARTAGALGARLTGAGFGGCGVALVPASSCNDIVHQTRTRYLQSGFSRPTFMVLQPVGGAVAKRSNAL